MNFDNIINSQDIPDAAISYDKDIESITIEWKYGKHSQVEIIKQVRDNLRKQPFVESYHELESSSGGGIEDIISILSNYQEKIPMIAKTIAEFIEEKGHSYSLKDKS